MTVRQNCESELTNYKACNTFSISSSKTRVVFSLVVPITGARRAFHTATRHPRSRSWVGIGRPSDPLFAGSVFRRQLGDHRSETSANPARQTRIRKVHRNILGAA